MVRSIRPLTASAVLVSALASAVVARGEPSSGARGGEGDARAGDVDGGVVDGDPIEAPKIVPSSPSELPASAESDGGARAATTVEPSAAHADEPLEEKPRTRFTVAVGPTLYASFASSGGAPRLIRPGVVVDGALVLPLGERVGLGLRAAWGLTEFHRFEDFARAGYRVGKWTTTAYGDVWEWATVSDDAAAFRLVGGVFASVLLLFPYLVAAGMYALAPVSPTTYLETDVTAVVHLAPDARDGVVPYLKPGLALAAVLAPRSDRLVGGAGPTLGLGVRSGHLDVAIKGTWLPPYLHGEGGRGRSHIVLTGVTLGYSL